MVKKKISKILVHHPFKKPAMCSGALGGLPTYESQKLNQRNNTVRISKIKLIRSFPFQKKYCKKNQSIKKFSSF